MKQSKAKQRKERQRKEKQKSEKLKDNQSGVGDVYGLCPPFMY